MGFRASSGASNAGACCLCFAWVLALFAIVSPYWLWRRKFAYPFFTNPEETTYGIGSFIASYTSNPVPCYCVGLANCACDTKQWNHYDFGAKVCSSASFSVLDANGNAITSTPFDLVGQYGWCDSVDASTSSIPRHNRMIYVLGSAGIGVFFLATIIAFASPHFSKSSILLLAAVLAIFGFIFTLSSFSLACTSAYNKSFFGSGGYLPLQSSSGAFAVSNQIELFYGPSFWCMVASCILGLLATISIMYGAKLLKEEADMLP